MPFYVKNFTLKFVFLKYFSLEFSTTFLLFLAALFYLGLIDF